MIYLDNSSTTEISQVAIEKIVDILQNNNYNPSALYDLGMKSEKEIFKSSKVITEILGCKGEEIIFTSGGTESNNMAIFGVCSRLRKNKRNIVTTSIEHDSVLVPFKTLEEQGFNVKFVKPNRNGVITTESILNEISDETGFLSIMMVNNEIGTINDIKKIVKDVKKKNSDVIIHCDAVQAFCKIDFSAEDLGVDLISISGHKVNAPKGVGALFIKKNLNINPLIYGGSQQKKLRGGTENVAYISAFAVSAKENYESIAENSKKIKIFKYS